MANTASRRVFAQADGTFIVNEYDIRGTFIREVSFADEEQANTFAANLGTDVSNAHDVPAPVEPESETPIASESPVVDGQSEPIEPDQAPVAPEQAPEAPAEEINQ